MITDIEFLQTEGHFFKVVFKRPEGDVICEFS